MRTRTSDNWTQRPGSFDYAKMDQQFPSSNKWGIPDVDGVQIELVKLPEIPIPLNLVKEKNQGQKTKKYLVHFFLDDYHYEYLWSRPVQILDRIVRAGNMMVSPDFSIYSDIAPAVNIWNLYRNAWLAKYCQAQGITVIPLLTWAGQAGFEYCFAGLPQNSTMATSAMGIKISEFSFFKEGLLAAIEKTHPYNLICFGIKFQEEIKDLLQGKMEVRFYQSYWEYKDLIK